MAFKIGSNQSRVGKINRTPGPVAYQRQGGHDYGEAGPLDPAVAASLPPGVGGPQSVLGRNLRESVDDDAIDQVQRQGTARSFEVDKTGRMVKGQGDSQLRDIGRHNVAQHPSMDQNAARQSGGVDQFKRANLPSKVGESFAEPVRKPGAADEVMKLNGFDAQSLSDVQRGRRKKA
jgi:hypothetical protein